MSLTAKLLDDAIDLSAARVTQASPTQLSVTTQVTSVHIGVAVVMALISAGFLFDVWLNRDDLLSVIVPHALFIPLCAFFAVVTAFRHQQKAVDGTRRTVTSSVRMGPWASSQRFDLPMRTKVKLTLRLSSVHGRLAPVRHYDIAVEGVPACRFSIADERDTARVFAATLAQTLQCSITEDDAVENDGIQRIAPHPKKHRTKP